MSTTSRPRRLSPQQAQEHLSRAQLCEALGGWIVNPLSLDFGEDFLVSIYDNGRSTGLTFQLQLKSRIEVASLVTKKAANDLHYPLEVSDLEHWEDASPPVVVVIWDVTRRCGYWQDVPTIIESISQGAPRWRSKASATVAIPLQQTLDVQGRDTLRQRVGRLVLPAISRGKALEVQPTFCFPPTISGRSSLAALQTVIEDGGEITIDKEHIHGLSMSPWWERIFGARIPESVTIKSAGSDITFVLHIEAVGVSGVERVSVILHRTKVGIRRATFTNIAEHDPLRLTVVLDGEAGTLAMGFKFTYPHPNVITSLVLTKLILIVRGGGALRVSLESGEPLGEFNGPLDQLPTMVNLKAWERMLTMLASIQSKTGRYGLFSIHENFKAAEFQNVARVWLICSTAHEEARMTLRFNLSAPPKRVKTADMSSQPDISLIIDPYADIELFGVTIPTGKVRVTFLDGHDALNEFAAATRERRCKLVFKDTRVRLTYLDWLPPMTGPQLTAASRRLPAPRQSASTKKTRDPRRGRSPR